MRDVNDGREMQPAGTAGVSPTIRNTSGSEARDPRLPPPAGGRVDLLVVAGEHSGDEHAARMVRELRERQPALRIAALGGPQLAAAGAQLLHDMTASSVVGIVEVLKNYPFFKALFADTLRWIAEHRPGAVCFVDYPGLNLRLAAAMRDQGLSRKGGGKIKTLYYISPQIWAWKAKRRFTMARDLDAMAVIFPFEPACYSDTSLSVEFVGHPFVAPDYRSPVRYDPNGPILLLPGSRKQAVHRIFPVLLSGFRAFGQRDAVVLYPSAEILDVLRAVTPPPNVRLIQINEGHARPEPIAASAVLTSSGTMSMHCALAAIPGAIAYRANLMTYVLGRFLLNVEYLGIANLLLKEPMYPEYIQDAATPAALAKELRAAVQDPTRRDQTAAQAARLRALLSVPATGTAADWLIRHLE
jgi:lipid-A-disaccharide synthase